MANVRKDFKLVTKQIDDLSSKLKKSDSPGDRLKISNQIKALRERSAALQSQIGGNLGVADKAVEKRESLKYLNLDGANDRKAIYQDPETKSLEKTRTDSGIEKTRRRDPQSIARRRALAKKLKALRSFESNNLRESLKVRDNFISTVKQRLIAQYGEEKAHSLLQQITKG